MAEGNGQLQVLYGLDGKQELPEVTLSHFEGYKGSKPVRIGNGAAAQLQLDIYGGRTHGRGLSVQQVRRTHLLRLVAKVDGHHRSGSRELAAARPRHLGGAQRTARVFVLAVDVLGHRR